MREYSRRQAANQRTLQEHLEAAASRLPRLRQIDEETAALGAGRIRAVLAGSQTGVGTLREDLARLSEERKALLASIGLPEDYLDMHYTCPKCQDTGYVGSEKCSCLRSAEIAAFYSQSSIHDVFRDETFAHFSLAFYSDRIIHESTGLTERQTAEKALTAAQLFVQQFDEKAANLFLYGDTGTGKTFLSHCIAHELLASGHLVLYFSAHDLFERLAGFAFSREDTEGTLEDILSCDLLIIDDLGTEMTNTFTTSQLFLCVNERLLRQKSTLISTNLKLEDFSSVYSERTFSRIAGHYQMIKLIGQDIRLQKRFA